MDAESVFLTQKHKALLAANSTNGHSMGWLTRVSSRPKVRRQTEKEMVTVYLSGPIKVIPLQHEEEQFSAASKYLNGAQRCETVCLQDRGRWAPRQQAALRRF